MILNEYIDYLVNWIQAEVNKANAKGVVIGLSGGVDSSVVAALAKRAFPENALGVILPIHNMGNDLEDAIKVASQINIKTKTIDLTNSFEELKNVIDSKNQLALANIKPRLRMTALYSIAQENNYLVLGTDNAAEWILGYFTKYGDGGVDLLPIVQLTKGEVKKIAQLLELPEIIYTKPPTAGLWENQTDEDELGFSYNQVDAYLKGKEIDVNIKSKIEQLIKTTAHKRKSVPKPNPMK